MMLQIFFCVPCMDGRILSVRTASAISCGAGDLCGSQAEEVTELKDFVSVLSR